MFNVGELLTWNSRFQGKVKVEYRGKQFGVDGWECCVIVREEGKNPEQLMVPLTELSK